MLKRNYFVPKDRPLIDNGYKYNARRFLYLISTKDTCHV